MSDDAIESPAELVHEVLPAQDGSAALGRSIEGALRFSFSFDLPKLPRFDAYGSWSHQAMLNAALGMAIALIVVVWLFARMSGDAEGALLTPAAEPAQASIRQNVASVYNPTVDAPAVDADAHVERSASVVGNVTVRESAYVGERVVVDSSAGQPIHIGGGANLQPGAIVTARPTFVNNTFDRAAFVHVDGDDWAVYIGTRVSIGAGVHLAGPVAVMDGAYIGQGANVVGATIGEGAVVEPGATVMGVQVQAGRYVPAGSVVATQAEADALPVIDPQYAFANAGERAVALHLALLKGLGLSGLVGESGDEAAAGQDVSAHD